jgi:hypothetical protein
MTPAQWWVTVVVILQDQARLAGDLNLPLCYRVDLPEDLFHAKPMVSRILIEFVFGMMAQSASSAVAAVGAAFASHRPRLDLADPLV